MQTRRAHRPRPVPAPLLPCVCNTLRMAARRVTQLYDEALRPSGLRVTQFSILATLARLGAANLTPLTEALVMDQTTLTRSLQLLEAQGLIERVAQPDGRVKAMRVTARGRRALRHAGALWAQAQTSVLRAVGTASWRATRRGLARLLAIGASEPRPWEREAVGHGRRSARRVESLRVLRASERRTPR